jgi:hypothetical protein
MTEEALEPFALYPCISSLVYSDNMVNGQLETDKKHNETNVGADLFYFVLFFC